MKHFRFVLITGALIASLLGLTALAGAQSADAAQTAYLGIAFEGAEGGVAVVSVVADSPAEAAGILAGDVITAIAETPVSEDNVQATVQSLAVGDTVPVAILRDGEELSVDVTLVAAPETSRSRTRTVRPTIEIFRSSGPLLGVSIEDAEEGGAKVVYVTEGSPADAAGILVDDVITAINDVAVTTAQEAVDTVKQLGEAAEIGTFDLTATVTRGEETLTLTATLTKEEANTQPESTTPRLRDLNRFGAGLGGFQIVPREGVEDAYDIVVPFSPANPEAVTAEVTAALAEVGIAIAPVEGEEGAYTLTLPLESLGNGQLRGLLEQFSGRGFGMPDGFEFSTPRGRNFRFSIPETPVTPTPTPDDAAA